MTSTSLLSSIYGSSYSFYTTSSTSGTLSTSNGSSQNSTDSTSTPNPPLSPQLLTQSLVSSILMAQMSGSYYGSWGMSGDSFSSSDNLMARAINAYLSMQQAVRTYGALNNINSNIINNEDSIFSKIGTLEFQTDPNFILHDGSDIVPDPNNITIPSS